MNKKWMVYYINSDGYREGNETILALDRDEAINLYKRYFNVTNYDECKAIPIIDVEARGESSET